MTETSRQLMLVAEPPFEIPDVNGLAEGAVVSSSDPEQFATRYFDTGDLRLARWGVSFCQRLGQEWTVKLPSQSESAALSGLELTFPDKLDSPPASAVDLVRAFTRAAELAPQAQVRTTRRRIEMRDRAGNLLAGMVDEENLVLDVRRPVRLHELKVKIGAEAPLELQELLLERLHEAGASVSDLTPRHMQVLGSDEDVLPEVVVQRLTSGATAGDVVRRALASSVVRLIQHDPVVRLDVDAEGVHQARVATRRLRSDLRTFRSLLDPGWVSALRDELRWLAEILGHVRDNDVMLERMRKRVAELDHPPDASRVLAALDAEREVALAELLEGLRSERYTALLERLVSAGGAPALLLAADQPAAEVLPGLVQSPWRILQKRVRALDEDPSDEALHDVRIASKRLRYAAEAVTPLVGRQAQAFATAASSLQTVLGEFNDAIVAEAWLREWTRGSRSVQGVFAAGELAGLERAHAQRLRSRWRKAWRKLSAPALRSWMS